MIENLCTSLSKDFQEMKLVKTASVHFSAKVELSSKIISCKKEKNGVLA